MTFSRVAEFAEKYAAFLRLPPGHQWTKCPSLHAPDEKGIQPALGNLKGNIGEVDKARQTFGQRTSNAFDTSRRRIPGGLYAFIGDLSIRFWRT